MSERFGPRCRRCKGTMEIQLMDPILFRNVMDPCPDCTDGYNASGDDFMQIEAELEAEQYCAVESGDSWRHW